MNTYESFDNSTLGALGMNASINVTIHEKMSVKSNISATLFPRLLAKLALIINGNRKTNKITKIIAPSDIPRPNIALSFVAFSFQYDLQAERAGLLSREQLFPDSHN